MKKRSVRQWITLCFTVILVLSLAVTAAWNYYTSYTKAVEQSDQQAESCAYIVRSTLNSWSFSEVLKSDDDVLYTGRRNALRTLCQRYNLDYLYVYTIDPETEFRHYLFCVAADDEKEKVVLKERYLGAVSDTPLSEGERALLAGSREIQKGSVSNQFGDEEIWLVPFRPEPYFGGEGRLYAVIGMDYNIHLANEKILHDFFIAVFPVVLALTMGFLGLLILLQRRILLPIRAISESMNRFAEDGSRKPEPLNIRSEDEIGEIASSYEKMTEDISAYVNNIENLTKERLEANVQLDVARRIQYGLVPEKTAFSEDGFHVSATTRPAKAVGGDFYDCFRRGENGVCAVMGDVSGKGISAAIFMAMAKTMIHEKLAAGLSPAETLNQVNDALCGQNPEGLFATAFVAVLDPGSGEVRYANAGHTLPVLVGKDPHFLHPDSGIALGLFEDAGLEDGTLLLEPGEGILLYTDGVTEAVSPEHALFGEDRLLDALKNASVGEDPAEDTVRAVIGAVDRFCGGNEAFDDTAILALFRDAADPAGSLRPLPVSLASFGEVKEAVFSCLGDTPEARRVLLACDEALTNIVSYSGASELAFSCEKDGGGLKIGFRDDGIPYDPTAAQSGEKAFEELDLGGMGLSIIRQIASSVEYARTEGRNVLTLRFSDVL